MNHAEVKNQFDVVVIGAGPAGVTAAGALAGTGISVALLETGVYAGAENWSGCVYFTESLAAADSFGRDPVEAAPFERRIVRRGTLMHDGLDAVGMELTDPAVFQDCYTVLRPVYDAYFAHLARARGAVLIPGTTVTSLIRKNNRVIGVETNRGPLYADVAFIAEGDASHLVRAEQLERVARPHFHQGVKAVLSLASDVIEKRFNLGPGQGAAYEILLRNPSLAGRAANLNIGGFLYTNRDSLSMGYVAPLDAVRDDFRGSHDAVYEWMRNLPSIRELIDGAKLSAYGTKIIRTGGWDERPVLVEDGLAVGGAATGLGVDVPFPNVTGPASASGLFFARAVKNIAKRGGAFDANTLSREYVVPLQDSVYGRNARHLSQWPEYFGRSRVLFGWTVDVACGAAHFLSQHGFLKTARFLRGHIVSFKAVRELASDTNRMISSLRLWRPLMSSLLTPATVWQWAKNQFRRVPEPDRALGIIMKIDGKESDARALPWPVGNLLRRISPALLSAVRRVYANNGREVKDTLAEAVRLVVRSIRLSDILVLPAYSAALVFTALITGRRPIRLVTAYEESRKKLRDLDQVKPSVSLEAKLATNTYRIGTESHIRTLWPEALAAQPDMAKSGLWSLCPARVYVYDRLTAGRGRVTVNYENCIKCESCWRAEPERALWGRHTNHALIFRPETSAIERLLAALAQNPARGASLSGEIRSTDSRLQDVQPDTLRAGDDVLNAAAAFGQSVRNLPASADTARRSWPAALGKRLAARLAGLETALLNENRHEQAETIAAEKAGFELRLTEGRLFHAEYCCRRIEELVNAWMDEAIRRSEPSEKAGEVALPKAPPAKHLSPEAASALFPDAIVKQWEEEPMPEEWSAALSRCIDDHRGAAMETVRVLSSINPAFGLIAVHRYRATAILEQAGSAAQPGVCAVDADHLSLTENMDTVRIKGMLVLVPVAASTTLLVLANSKGYLVPLAAEGVTVTPTPAIGFRAADLSTVSLDCEIANHPLPIADGHGSPAGFLYLAIALGAADYLARRVKEHAASRVQFSGQMLDTEGRDGIAKLGAVKAMIARVEAWRLLLESLYDIVSRSQLRAPNSELSLLSLICSAIAAKAFGPEPGCMGYDAGQVFGGFAYSEDDLLSRSFRDSSLFRFLAPGYRAAERLNTVLEPVRLDQALPSLGDVDSVQGDPLGGIASRLTTLIQKCMALPSGADHSSAGLTKAMVIGIRALLCETERKLSSGESAEGAANALEVLLSLTEDMLLNAELSGSRGGVSPSSVFPIEPAGVQESLDPDYDAFCTAAGAPHRSGSFLLTAFDRARRFVPEMQLHDTKLRARWSGLVEWFKTNCADKKFDGLDFERAVEKLHALPQEIMDAVKDNKWLAAYISPSLDGLGWRKADYYILLSAAGSFGDVAIDLLIMANTSIGTTPILISLEEDLPRTRKELEPLLQDEQMLGEIGWRLARLTSRQSDSDPSGMMKEYEAIMHLVDVRIRKTRVVKYLAQRFLRSFSAAGNAGMRGDFKGFIAKLKQAEGLFGNLLPDVRAALDELPRREQCHKLFLRYLGHGGVSAFALTEPTAGSDSAGVKTTAKLMKARLIPLDDGRYSFHPDGSEQTVRYLIDSDRIVPSGRSIAYATPDGNPQPIRYDKYDYATDEGARYYIYRGKQCVFHDIGQVRNQDSGPTYEYYSLTGAKMWITSASIATQMCLYALTPEGVTGFMVDRHSEGLKVGADEKKTGQWGSPTNEISLDSVRVPREAMIGNEGRGQVNALETLNVGRTGIAFASVVLMRKLMHEANEIIPLSPERDGALGEAAAIVFGSESLSYYVVGLFDRPHGPVRMESAIAKFICAEDIHELITLVEEAFGPMGQTQKFLLEKARRDSRVLTIYEGTSEIQRFLILKDLIASAGDWKELPEQQGPEADKTLAAWKNRIRSHVKEAADLLGDLCWSDAMLEPAFFPLSEMAGEILRLECIYYRLEWLESRKSLASLEMLAAGRRAATRTLARLERLEKKYVFGYENVRNNMDLPEVRAADAALDEALREKAAPPAAKAPLRTPVRILCIARPIADLSPHPRLANHALQELVWRIDPSDLAGLAQALELKADSEHATVDVLMPGRSEHDFLLRMTAGDANNLYRLDGEPTAGPKFCIGTVKELDAIKPYDLIIAGADCLDGNRSLGAYFAGALARNLALTAALDVKGDGSGLADIELPAVVAITSRTPSRVTRIDQAVESSFKDIRVLSTMEKPHVSRYALPSAAEPITPTITTPAQAAEYLRLFAASAKAATALEYSGRVKPGKLITDNAVWALLDPHQQKSNLAVLRAAGLAARFSGRTPQALVAAPKDQWPQLLGLAQKNGCADAFCMDTKNGQLSPAGKRNFVRILAGKSDQMVLFAGTEWTVPFGWAAGESGKQLLLCSNLTRMAKQENNVLFSQPVYEARLVRMDQLKGDSAFVTVSPEADLPAPAETSFRAYALDLEFKPDWIMPLPRVAPPTLSQADVIISLGYGIKDKAGFALALELKDRLEALGLEPMFGATRKVTQDLKLLPIETQIGQTGISVNPKLIIALGVSGAPQHIDYIGTRAEILCFNKDSEAPLMNLNKTKKAPRVHPVPGDLFVTVREMIEKLEELEREEMKKAA